MQTVCADHTLLLPKETLTPKPFLPAATLLTALQARARALERSQTGKATSFITVTRTVQEGPRKGQGVPVTLPTGSVRASLGPLSTFEDVHAFVEFLRTIYLQ